MMSTVQSSQGTRVFGTPYLRCPCNRDRLRFIFCANCLRFVAKDLTAYCLLYHKTCQSSIGKPHEFRMKVFNSYKL